MTATMMKATLTTPTDQTIEIERIFNAAERVLPPKYPGS